MAERACAITSGPPMPRLGEDRLFRAGDEALAARAWALAGGIAIVGDRRRWGPALRVFGRHALLLQWGSRHGLDPRGLHPVTRRMPAHLQVFGSLAQELERRALAEGTTR